MENIDKVYTQEEVDAITERVKQNQQSKVERNYVSKEDFANLEAKYNDLVKTTKSTGIKNTFMNLGGLESSFDDLLALNPNLLNIEDSKLKDELSKIKEQKPYFFDNVYRSNSQFNNQSSTIVDDTDTMLNMLNVESPQNLSNTIVGIDGEDENEHFK